MRNEVQGASRNQIIVRTSIIGIAANLFLVIFKAGVGFISGSIAIILDAVNNLSDALSSVITIIGAKLAGKKPDKKHPLGHGRAEYLSAMTVAAIILYAGVTSLIESIKKIITPKEADYSAVTLAVVGAAVFIKLFLGTFVKRTGKKVNSASLIASGSDALFDAVVSMSVLLSALIFVFFKLSLEAYVGVLISLYIIFSGYKMMTGTLDDILGKRIDENLLEKIRKTIEEDSSVLGAYDLILHSYGPEYYLGSVHVEIPDTMTAYQIDALERSIAERVYKKHGILLTCVGIYSIDVSNKDNLEMREVINKLALSHEGVLQTHGFYVDKENKAAILDVIIDYSVKDRKALLEHIKHDIEEKYPDYSFKINMDIDF